VLFSPQLPALPVSGYSRRVRHRRSDRGTAARHSSEAQQRGTAASCGLGAEAKCSSELTARRGRGGSHLPPRHRDVSCGTGNRRGRGGRVTLKLSVLPARGWLPSSTTVSADTSLTTATCQNPRATEPHVLLRAAASPRFQPEYCDRIRGHEPGTDVDSGIYGLCASAEYRPHAPLDAQALIPGYGITRKHRALSYRASKAYYVGLQGGKCKKCGALYILLRRTAHGQLKQVRKLLARHKSFLNLDISASDCVFHLYSTKIYLYSTNLSIF
jgi:hypothetical protein